MKAALLILALSTLSHAAPLPTPDEKLNDALESSLHIAKELKLRQLVVQKEQLKFSSTQPLTAQAALFKAHDVEIAKIDKELAALQHESLPLILKSTTATKHILEEALPALVNSQRALTHVHQDNAKALKAAILTAKKAVQTGAARLQKDEADADKVVKGLATLPAAQQAKAASAAQAQLSSLKIMLDNLSSQAAEVKLAVSQAPAENISISDMFDQQLLMNKLSQMTEMVSAVTSASQQAVTNMARTPGH